MRGNYEKDIGGLENEETPADDPARPAPPHKGAGGGLPPPRGITAARPPFIICGLRHGLCVSSISAFVSFPERSWSSSGRLGDIMGTSWRHLGASWGRLEGVLGRLGIILGASWGRLGLVLEASWAVLGASGGRLGASWSVQKHHRRQS